MLLQMQETVRHLQWTSAKGMIREGVDVANVYKFDMHCEGCSHIYSRSELVGVLLQMQEKFGHF